MWTMNFQMFKLALEKGYLFIIEEFDIYYRQHIKKQGHYFVDKVSSSQNCGFSSSHVCICEESGGRKNWYFWTVVLEKTLESPLDCKEIQPVHPKGDQSWVFIRRTNAEAETPILWPPHAESWLVGKDPDPGNDWGQEEKGTTEDEMTGWHHWLRGHEFEQTLGVCDGQGGLVCCNSWGRKELDTTELSILHMLFLTQPTGHNLDMWLLGCTEGWDMWSLSEWPVAQLDHRRWEWVFSNSVERGKQFGCWTHWAIFTTSAQCPFSRKWSCSY